MRSRFAMTGDANELARAFRPPIRAASARDAPSWTTGSASRRRACPPSLALRATARWLGAAKSPRGAVGMGTCFGRRQQNQTSPAPWKSRRVTISGRWYNPGLDAVRPAAGVLGAQSDHARNARNCGCGGSSGAGAGVRRRRRERSGLEGAGGRGRLGPPANRLARGHVAQARASRPDSTINRALSSVAATVSPAIRPNHMPDGPNPSRNASSSATGKPIPQ